MRVSMAVNRGSAREIALVNSRRKTAEAVATDARLGTPLSPKVAITTALKAPASARRCRKTLGERSSGGKLLSKYEARRIAPNVAELRDR
jgi:hypothetical protein